MKKTTTPRTQSPQALSVSAQRVLDLLRQAQKPLTAYEILDRLRRYGMKSPPTIYRALESLLKNGMVHRLESLNAFMACRCADHPDSHHAQKGAVPFVICKSCGQVSVVENRALAASIKKIAGSYLADYDHGVLELTGICHACAPSIPITRGCP